MPKQTIRKRLLSERRHCSPESCLLWSRQVQERFLAGELYRRADCLGLYSPLQNEVQTEFVARQVRLDGKRLVYPRVRGLLLEFCPVNGSADLVPGTFGVLEPVGESLSLTDIDLLIMPGVAFDRIGHRLGFGKGYYDRTLADCPATLVRVGFAYEFQVVARLPATEHDCRVTWLVTEQHTLHFTA